MVLTSLVLMMKFCWIGPTSWLGLTRCGVLIIRMGFIVFMSIIECFILLSLFIYGVIQNGLGYLSHKGKCQTCFLMWKLHLKLLIAFSPINFFQSRDRALAQLKKQAKETSLSWKEPGIMVVAYFDEPLSAGHTQSWKYFWWYFEFEFE